MRRFAVLPAIIPLALLGACATVRGGDPLVEAFTAADSLRVENVAPGLRHAFAWEARGPWAVHVAEVEPSACLVIEARHAGPPLARAAPTSAIAEGALAAVNADFFALPEGTPVGAQVTGGEVLAAPGRWQAVGFGAEERAVGTAALVGAVRVEGRELPIAAVNRPAADSAPEPGIRLYTSWHGAPVPVHAGSVVVPLAAVQEGTTSGAGRVGVPAVDSGSVAVPAGGALLEGPAAALSGLAPGDTVLWTAEVLLGEAFVPSELVGGFPVLLRGGEVPPELATEPRPSFGEQRHPRTAVGWRAGGPVLLVTVDGRQAPYSDGMTLAELAGLMRRLGATEALNLDGGGSTTMVLRGRVVNRTSDASGERPVGNALVVVQKCAR